MKKSNIVIFIILHILLMVYSLSSVCSKTASGASFLSWKFIVFYGLVIFILGIYAIGWQQIIKRLPLTTAFANKAVTVVWGIIWGAVFFHEKITAGKLIGAAIVIVGVVLYVKADAELAEEIEVCTSDTQIDQSSQENGIQGISKQEVDDE